MCWCYLEMKVVAVADGVSVTVCCARRVVERTAISCEPAADWEKVHACGLTPPLVGWVG